MKNKARFKDEALTHLDALYGYAWKLARSHEDAEDLVQEAYTRLAGMSRMPENPAEYRPLLFRIVHNAFVDQWRARQRAPLMISTDRLQEDGVFDLFPALQDARTPLQELMRDGLSDEVERALSELDAEWRETLWLREIEGFSYEEISNITESPIGTVRSRLSRARGTLAARLRDYARTLGIGNRPVKDRKEEQSS